ncbi:PREDICTED: protein OSB2, chloroplastic isoform X2 [Camelina sativa]|uniref:Protein OSB2, chloroplastic isoform X2 n=1 Tax=Camelina sativa TaxID=90675 RepID=A0ABM0U164_CAMSA|nr:PREDICTED: protein OSB2, chloroplastic isoform X2 [Camelina sativa]
MNSISKSLTRIECSPFFHPRPSETLTGKRMTSPPQIRFYTAAAVGGKNGSGGKRQRAKAPEVATSTKPPEIVAPVTATKENGLARPNEIAYESEVANWVNLVGFVDQPVQFEASSDGKCWAGTVISQRSASDSSAFWIPIIFEGDLAKTAARYLKKDDQIHVSGKLFIDTPPPNMTYAQANVQVLVQNLNFLQPTSPSVVISSSEKEESGGIGIKKQPAKKDVVMDEASDSWNHLTENPKEWWDHRENKVNGLVKPRHPDFKSKDSSLSLWLNKAPNWVLPKLEGLEFDVLVPKARVVKQLKGEESWKDLVQNPDKWWDNRIDKRNAKAPDFKHKETGEALWLNESPTWVLPKLPPPVKKRQESIVS